MLLAVSSFFNPGGLLAERQPFAGLGMKIVTQARKFVAGRDAIQSQVRRTLAEPLAGDGLPFGVVIADGQMLFEVFLGIDSDGFVVWRPASLGVGFGSANL